MKYGFNSQDHITELNSVQLSQEQLELTRTALEQFLSQMRWLPPASTIQICTKFIEAGSLAEIPGHLNLPTCLQKVPLHADKRLRFSQKRMQLASEVAGLINSHFTSKTGKALVISCDGPTGTGKTSFLTEIAGRTEFDVFRPLNIRSPYPGKTAERVQEIFCFLGGRRAILLWDEIDSLLNARSGNETDMQRDELDFVSKLLNELDNSEVVLLCTTNFGAILDKAFTSRIQRRITMGSIDTEDREFYFVSKFEALGKRLPADLLRRLARACDDFSYRDLDKLIALIEKSGPDDVTSVWKAWRSVSRETSQDIRTTWIPQGKSDVAFGIGNEVASLDAQLGFEKVAITFKGQTKVRFGELASNGFLRYSDEVVLDSDARSARFEEQKDVLLLSANNDLNVVRGLFKPDEDWQDVSLNANVLDARWSTLDPKILVAVTYESNLLGSDLSTLDVVRYENGKLKVLSDVKIDGATSCASLGIWKEKEYFAVVSENSQFAIVSLSDLKLKVEKQVQTYGIDSGRYSARKIETYPGEDGYFIIVPGTKAVGVWHWTPDGECTLENTWTFPQSKGLAQITIDTATGRLAVGLENHLYIFDSFADFHSREPQKINVDGEGTISAITFAGFGKVLICGTTKGDVITAKCQRISIKQAA